MGTVGAGGDDALGVLRRAAAEDELARGFANPPRQARLRAYWWWLNGCVDKAAITRDLEEMRAKGFGGALICDADGSSQDGNERAPHGPTFFSPAWRELYRHALAEADRLGLEMSLNVQSGWNLGGPMVKPEQAPKKIVWSESRLAGPAKVERKLPRPPSREGFYRDTFVVAYRVRQGADRPGPQARVSVSWEQEGHPAGAMSDGDPATFWVGGAENGAGPLAEAAGLGAIGVRRGGEHRAADAFAARRIRAPGLRVGVLHGRQVVPNGTRIPCSERGRDEGVVRAERRACFA